MSGLLDQLERYSFSATGQPLCIYGDPAYPKECILSARLQKSCAVPWRISLQSVHEPGQSLS